MSILNVNQIQPVGGGNTITVSASDVSASGVTITASSFVGPLTGNVTGNITGNITGNVTGNITGTTSNASGATGDFSIADKIVHTGDTNTAIRFPAADTITAETGGTERIRITSGGLLGVGTNNPDRMLSVSDQTNGNLARFIGPTNNLFIMNNRSGIIDLNSSGTGDHLCLGTQNIERIRITSGGDVQVKTGNLVIGTSGKGIDFSAADNAGGMQSEILDDYEEGTYSASITMGGSGTVTMNPSYDTLSYTKIGRMVYVTGQIRVSSVSSPVGGTIINLPFTVRNNIPDARGGGTVTLYINGQAHYYWPLVYQIAESTSKINVTHNATGYFLPAAGNEYAISIMYIVS